MNFEVLKSAAQRFLDNEIEKRVREGGKGNALTFVDKMLENHKECEGGDDCPGGTMLREARARLVNPLDEAELEKLGIYAGGVAADAEAKATIPLTVFDREKGEEYVERGNEIVEKAAKMGFTATEMTKREKLLFFAGMAVDPEHRMETIALAKRIGLIEDRNEFMSVLVPAVAWFTEIVKETLS